MEVHIILIKGLIRRTLCNTQAAELAKYLAENDYKLTVVGLPKTIDNDVYPIKQSLGCAGPWLICHIIEGHAGTMIDHIVGHTGTTISC